MSWAGLTSHKGHAEMEEGVKLEITSIRERVCVGVCVSVRASRESRIVWGFVRACEGRYKVELSSSLALSGRRWLMRSETVSMIIHVRPWLMKLRSALTPSPRYRRRKRRAAVSRVRGFGGGRSRSRLLNSCHPVICAPCPDSARCCTFVLTRSIG